MRPESEGKKKKICVRRKTDDPQISWIEEKGRKKRRSGLCMPTASTGAVQQNDDWAQPQPEILPPPNRQGKRSDLVHLSFFFPPFSPSPIYSLSSSHLLFLPCYPLEREVWNVNHHQRAEILHVNRQGVSGCCIGPIFVLSVFFSAFKITYPTNSLL